MTTDHTFSTEIAVVSKREDIEFFTSNGYVRQPDGTYLPAALDEELRRTGTIAPPMRYHSSETRKVQDA